MLGIYYYYISSSNSQLTDKVDFIQVYTACIQVGQFFLLSFDQNRKYVRSPQKLNILPPKIQYEQCSTVQKYFFFQLRKINLFVPSHFFFCDYNCLVSGFFFVKVIDWNITESFCKANVLLKFNVHFGKIVFPLHCTVGIRGQQPSSIYSCFMRLFTLRIQIVSGSLF